MLKRFWLLPLALVVGCATRPAPLEKIEAGMSKDELFEVMGKPKFAASTADGEYYWYDLKHESYTFKPWYEPHYVKVTDGQVVSHGPPTEYEVEAGQFDKYHTRMHEPVPTDPDVGRMRLRYEEPAAAMQE